MIELLFLTAIAAGIANPFQAGVNAQLNKQLGQPIWAGVIVYASGLAVLIAFQFCFRQPVSADKILGVSWWAWFGGLISVVPTVIGLTVAQRMGSTLFTGASITASIVTSVLLDHFGLIGFRQHGASPARLAGCGLMIAGLWIIARF